MKRTRRLAKSAVAAAALAALAGVIVVATLPLPHPHPDFSTPRWIGPVQVVDLETGAIAAERTLRIEGGRIQQVLEEAALDDAARAQRLDLGGAYVLPGLWDGHAVLTRYADALELPLQLAHGVTRLRSILDCPAEGRVSMFACQSHKTRWNAQVRNGALAGAIVMRSGSFPIDGPGRAHRDIPADHAAATPEQARTRVRRLAADAQGPDHLKTYDRLPRESFFALMDEARQLNVEVSGHVPAAVRLDEAVAAGLRVVSHARVLPIACSSAEDRIVALRAAGEPAPSWMALALDTQDAERCARTWATLREHGAYLSPTLITRWNETRNGVRALAADRLTRAVTPALFRLIWREDVAPIEAREPPVETLYARYCERAAELVAQAERAGVALLVGSDSNDPYVAPGVGLHQEMALWRRAGVPVRSILRSATALPARHAAAADLGRIAPGFVADALFVEANPLEDLDTVRRSLAVMQEGRLYPRAALDAILERSSATAHSWRYPVHVLRDFARNPRGFAD